MTETLEPVELIKKTDSQRRIYFTPTFIMRVVSQQTISTVTYTSAIVSQTVTYSRDIYHR